MSGRQRRPKSGRTNPLGIVSLFFGLVEVGFGIGLAVTSGVAQAAILSFMCLFATGIAITFFVILWKRNWVFYPPADFPGVSVGKYVEAMSTSSNTSELVIKRLTEVFGEGRASLVSADLPLESRNTVDRILDRMETNTIDNVRTAVLYVDAVPLKGQGGRKWEEPYDGGMLVQRLLDRVAFQLQPFPPYPYGTIWLLREAESGEPFDTIGALWANENNAPEDRRSLAEVGILGGMTLQVVAREKA